MPLKQIQGTQRGGRAARRKALKKKLRKAAEMEPVKPTARTIQSVEADAVTVDDNTAMPGATPG